MLVLGTQTNETNAETTEDVDIYMGFTEDTGQHFSLIQ